MLSINFTKTLALANVNMTLYYDVKNSMYTVTITTIRHCSKLEFGSGASKAFCPGIKRPQHAAKRALVNM